MSFFPNHSNKTSKEIISYQSAQLKLNDTYGISAKQKLKYTDINLTIYRHTFAATYEQEKRLRTKSVTSP